MIIIFMIWIFIQNYHLIELMKYNYNNYNQAKLKGKRARQSIVSKYCIDCVGKKLLRFLKRLLMVLILRLKMNYKYLFIMFLYV